MDGDQGHGRAYRFKSPEGHTHEVFWDVVWLKERGQRQSIYADRYASNRRRGVNPRRFDHVTYMVAKFKYAEEKAFWTALGLRNPDEVRLSGRDSAGWRSLVDREPVARHRGVHRSQHSAERRGVQSRLLQPRQPRGSPAGARLDYRERAQKRDGRADAAQGRRGVLHLCDRSRQRIPRRVLRRRPADLRARSWSRRPLSPRQSERRVGPGESVSPRWTRDIGSG